MPCWATPVHLVQQLHKFKSIAPTLQWLMSCHSSQTVNDSRMSTAEFASKNCSFATPAPNFAYSIVSLATVNNFLSALVPTTLPHTFTTNPAHTVYFDCNDAKASKLPIKDFTSFICLPKFTFKLIQHPDYIAQFDPRLWRQSQNAL